VELIQNSLSDVRVLGYTETVLEVPAVVTLYKVGGPFGVGILVQWVMSVGGGDVSVKRVRSGDESREEVGQLGEEISVGGGLVEEVEPREGISLVLLAGSVDDGHVGLEGS
jgi:hypothetical protein